MSGWLRDSQSLGTSRTSSKTVQDGLSFQTSDQGTVLRTRSTWEHLPDPEKEARKPSPAGVGRWSSGACSPLWAGNGEDLLMGPV